MKSLILAGGLGERLRPLTHVIPKPLLPIGEKSILEIIMEGLKSSGCDEIVIATNYKSDLFEKYLSSTFSKLGIKVTISKEEEPLGTAGPIKLVRHLFKEPFIVINGDILTSLDFRKIVETHKRTNAKLTVGTKEINTPLQYGMIESKDGSIIDNVIEKPNLTHEINAGIYVMNPELIDMIPEGKYNMTDLIKEMLQRGIRVAKHKIEEYWLDIGHMDAYQKAQKDINNSEFYSNETKE